MNSTDKGIRLIQMGRTGPEQIIINETTNTVSNNITGKVYVANCLLCDQFDFINGTSIYELNRDGSTINWKIYENIDLEENRLAINPFTDKLYALGTGVQSGMSNLYIIDISPS